MITFLKRDPIHSTTDWKVNLPAAYLPFWEPQLTAALQTSTPYESWTALSWGPLLVLGETVIVSVFFLTILKRRLNFVAYLPLKLGMVALLHLYPDSLGSSLAVWLLFSLLFGVELIVVSLIIIGTHLGRPPTAHDLLGELCRIPFLRDDVYIGLLLIALYTVGKTGLGLTLFRAAPKFRVGGRPVRASARAAEGGYRPWFRPDYTSDQTISYVLRALHSEYIPASAGRIIDEVTEQPQLKWRHPLYWGVRQPYGDGLFRRAAPHVAFSRRVSSRRMDEYMVAHPWPVWFADLWEKDWSAFWGVYLRTPLYSYVRLPFERYLHDPAERGYRRLARDNWALLRWLLNRFGVALTVEGDPFQPALPHLPGYGESVWSSLPPVIDLRYGLLFLLVLSSLTVYSIILAGWSSNSKYAFLGALRSAAQMISYEVSISLVLLPVVLCSGSLNLGEIAYMQSITTPYLFPLLPVALVFIVSMLAETNRTPFDLPEAEAELVAGYNVDYSSLPFAMFFLGEYANMLLIATLFCLLFLGGGESGPLHLSSPLLLGVEASLFWLFFILVRATLPRYRYDQLMDIGWKAFLPISSGYLLLLIGALIAFDLAPEVGPLLAAAPLGQGGAPAPSTPPAGGGKGWRDRLVGIRIR